MSGTAETPMRAEDLAAIPDDGARHELVRGTLTAEPRPKYGQVRIARLIAEHVEARDLGDVVSESGFVLSRSPDTVRGPDVAFVSRDRAPRADADGFFEGAPDLAVEILSPDDRPGVVLAKVADYLAAGARMVWVADPRREGVIVYRSLVPRTAGGDDLLDGADVLPGFEVPVSRLFRREPGGAPGR